MDINTIKQKFQSGNGIEVPEARVTKEEFDFLISKLRNNVTEDDEVERIRGLGPAYPYTTNTAPPTPLASAPVAGERAALQRIVDTAKDGANSGDRHARCVELARAVLASAPVAGEAQPGYALVPIEPTKEMLSAAFDLFELSVPEHKTGNDARRAIYKAMVNAAPQASAPVAGDDDWDKPAEDEIRALRGLRTTKTDPVSVVYGVEKALSMCRDAFPVPKQGSDLELLWAEAMSNPMAVPAYVKACIDKLSESV